MSNAPPPFPRSLTKREQDLLALIERAKAAFAALPPDEQQKIRDAQRESWVRGQTGWED